MKTMKENEWKALKKTEKRVLLAQDTLKWIKTGRIKPKSGVFCNISLRNKDKNAKKVFESRKSSCQVCAKGGFLYSRAMRVNCINLGEFEEAYNDYDLTNISPMKDCFDTEQWRTLENHFEGWDHYMKSGERTIETFYITETGSLGEQEISTLTLLFICLNLIHNKGKFALPTSETKQRLFHDNVVVPYITQNKEFRSIAAKLNLVSY